MQASNHGARARHFEPPPRLLALMIKPLGELPAMPPALSPLSRETFLKAYGVDPAAEAAVVAWLKEKKLTFRVDSRRRTVFVLGSDVLLRRAFGAVDEDTQGPASTLGVKRLPAELEGAVVAVLGMHTTLADTDPDAGPGDAANGYGVSGPAHALRTVEALRRCYEFPASFGKGQCIGVIEPDGGYVREDVYKALKTLGVSQRPQITDVIIKPELPPLPPEVHNAYADGNNDDPLPQQAYIDQFAAWMRGKGYWPRAWKKYFEVTMDITLVAALAPEADIQVFLGDGTAEGFLYMLQHAVLVAEPRPSVLSISWSFQERHLLNDASDIAAAHQIGELLKAAAMMGVTVCCSSGDWGATNVDDSFGGPGLDVAFPASSPWALACGGTTLLEMAGGKPREVVWNHDFPEETAELTPNAHVHGATGGGYSKLFPAPPWQTPEPGAPAGRGLPDVAAVADPRCGVDCQILGNTFPSFGTSASAPIWAGLVAVLNAELGVNVGCLNPLLHAASDAERAAMFTAITEGDNKMNAKALGFEAGPGWNPCTGFGTPRGQALLAYLKKLKGG